MTFPVSVIVPHLASREWFFQRFCLPSIQANGPAEIIVETNEGGDPRYAAISRNNGARKATQPFLFFVDDDTILGQDCLKMMKEALDANLEAAYAYSGFYQIALPSAIVPHDRIQIREAEPFSAERLWHHNYIHTTSLLRRELFPQFDEQLKRFQDWDLWLSILRGTGRAGVHVDKILYFLFSVDAGISAGGDHDTLVKIVKKKHGLVM